MPLPLPNETFNQAPLIEQSSSRRALLKRVIGGVALISVAAAGSTVIPERLTSRPEAPSPVSHTVKDGDEVWSIVEELYPDMTTAEIALYINSGAITNKTALENNENRTLNDIREGDEILFPWPGDYINKEVD